MSDGEMTHLLALRGGRTECGLHAERVTASAEIDSVTCQSCVDGHEEYLRRQEADLSEQPTERVRRLLRVFARPTLLSGRETPETSLLMPLKARQLRAIQDYLGVQYARRQPPLEEWDSK